MEKLTTPRNNKILATAISALALSGCIGPRYLNDASDIQCDQRRTIVELDQDNTVEFTVHGTSDQTAQLLVKKGEDGVSIKVTGDISGPKQELNEDGFTNPVPIVNGTEIRAFAAGGTWGIDARRDTVVIQGSCDGI